MQHSDSWMGLTLPAHAELLTPSVHTRTRVDGKLTPIRAWANCVRQVNYLASKARCRSNIKEGRSSWYHKAVLHGWAYFWIDTQPDRLDDIFIDHPHSHMPITLAVLDDRVIESSITPCARTKRPQAQAGISSTPPAKSQAANGELSKAVRNSLGNL